MSAQPTQAAPDDPGQQAADTPFYRRVLHDLINMGTDLARLLHQQAAAQAQPAQAQPAQAQPAQGTKPQPAPAPDAIIAVTVAFDHIARAVRRGILLARSLDQPAAPARDPARHRAAARKRILREIEDTIQRTASSDDAGLQAELHDRLDAPDLEDDLATRPIPAIITEICRDLGLASTPGAHPWKRRTPEDIQQLCARAATLRRHQPDAGPQPGRPRAPQHAPANPTPPRPISIGRPAIPHATAPLQAASVQAASDPQSDSADLIATILRHPIHGRDRWRPPPGA